MIRWNNLLLLLSLIPFLLLTSGCSTWAGLKSVEIKTVEVERTIPTQNHPRAESMGDVHFYIVTEDTLDEFKETIFNSSFKVNVPNRKGVVCIV